MKLFQSIPGYIILIIMIVAVSCKKDDKPGNPAIQPFSTENADAALKWADMILYTAKNSASNTPTYASRSYGYMGLAMYESIQAGSGRNQSLNRQLNGLNNLPKAAAGESYEWVLALNAGQANLLKKLYPHITDRNKLKIDSLYNLIYNTQLQKNISSAVVSRSVKFGEDIANAIYVWSLTDGGHEGFLKNFPQIDIPKGPGKWTPPKNGQVNSQLPLHPFWGNNRTFVTANRRLTVPEMIPYSTEPTSPYYKQFIEVYEKNKTLTQEEKEIVMWWSDDPSETAAPPGHSFNIGSIVIRQVKPDLFKAAETYARVGMAVADAFITCWKCKFFYWTQRPASFVNANIDSGWVQFFPEPPFPGFTSGHSTQAGAAAAILTDLYGNSFSFTDNTYEGRPKNELRNVEFKPRSFTSFRQFAEECAYSRLLGGIHIRYDNETGLSEGEKIANNINALEWGK